MNWEALDLSRLNLYQYSENGNTGKPGFDPTDPMQYRIDRLHIPMIDIIAEVRDIRPGIQHKGMHLVVPPDPRVAPVVNRFQNSPVTGQKEGVIDYRAFVYGSGAYPPFVDSDRRLPVGISRTGAVDFIYGEGEGMTTVGMRVTYAVLNDYAQYAGGLVFPDPMTGGRQCIFPLRFDPAEAPQAFAAPVAA